MNPAQHAVSRAELKPIQPAPAVATDWLVTHFVNFVERGEGPPVPVTVAMPDKLVTGWLVSADSYILGAVKDLQQDLCGTPDFVALRAALERLGDVLSAVTRDVHERPRYVHLEDARVVHGPVEIPMAAGRWWRVRIVSINGFSLAVEATDLAVDAGGANGPLTDKLPPTPQGVRHMVMEVQIVDTATGTVLRFGEADRWVDGHQNDAATIYRRAWEAAVRCGAVADTDRPRYALRLVLVAPGES